MASRSFAQSLRRTIQRYLRSKRGNVTFIGTLAAVPVIGAAGMAIDYARISRVHDRMQMVVDGAALAAVSAKNLSGTSTQKAATRITIAKSYLNNGFVALTDARLLGQPTVTANGATVSITARAEVKGSFTNVFDTLKTSSEIGDGGGGETPGVIGRTYGITVSTTASFKSGASPLCMLVLNPTDSQSLQIQGTADLFAPGCAVWVNSSSNSGLYENGTATMTAKTICVNGNYTGTGYYPNMPQYGATNCPVYPDPLKAKFLTDYDTAYADASANGPVNCFKTGKKCRYDGYSTTNKKYSPLTLTGSSTDVTLQPGIYDGGIDVKAGATVRLAAGTYFIQNGLFSTRQATVMNADSGGVTIIMTEPTAGTKVTNSTQTRIDIQAQTNLSLKAPSAGAFAGIVIAQHPNSITSTSKTTANSVIGGGVMSLTGMVYYPSNILYITGGGSGTVSSPERIATDDPLFAIVADKVFIEGNGQLRVGGASDNESAGLPALPAVGVGVDTVALK